LLRENQMFLALEAELAPLRAQERQLGERIAVIDKSYERLTVIARELETLQAQGVPDDAAIARLHGAQGAVQARQDAAQRQQQQIRAEESRLDGLTVEPYPRTWNRAAIPVGGLLLAVAFLAGVLGAVQQAGFGAVVAGMLFATGLGLMLAETRRRRRVADLRSERETAAVRLQEMQEGLQTALEELHREETALQAVVEAAGSATVEEALARHSRLRAIWEERSVVQGQVDALMGPGSVEALREELNQNRADTARREAALTRPEAQTKRLTQLAVQQLENDVKDLTQKVHRLQARQDHLERETAEGAPDYDALVTIQERLAERQDSQEATRRKARVYRAVREGLQIARQQTLIPARRLVEERAGEYLGLLTLGVYDRVKVEEPPLRVAVWVPQAEQWLEPAEPALSRGTTDQVYLAVRLALVEVLAEGRHPPLLLDDPFGTFDPERLRAAMALLRRVSGGNQVLLFTCRPEYEPFADRVIPLTEQPAPPEVPGPLWQAPPQTH